MVLHQNMISGTGVQNHGKKGVTLSVDEIEELKAALGEMLENIDVTVA